MQDWIGQIRLAVVRIGHGSLYPSNLRIRGGSKEVGLRPSILFSALSLVCWFYRGRGWNVRPRHGHSSVATKAMKLNVLARWLLGKLIDG